MKKCLKPLLFLVAVVLFSANSFSQTYFRWETFSTTTGGADDDYGDNHTITGLTTANGGFGNWTVASATSQIRNYVGGTTFVSPSSALILETTGDGSETITTSSASNIDLSSVTSGLCATNGLTMKFQLNRSTAITNHTLAVAFSDDGGGSYTTQSADVLPVLVAQNQWYTVAINIPNSYWQNDFRIRFTYSRSSGTGDATVLLEDIVITDPTVPDFSGVPTETTSGGAGFAVGDVYRYNSVVTSPTDYYAEITIEAISNATIDVLDNNAAGVANRFQPRIDASTSGGTLSSDLEGYVQFAIQFRRSDNNSVVSLSTLRYRHYDIDGNAQAAYTFRETGWISGHSSILVVPPSDLVDAGTIVDAGPPNPTTWRKILGELSEHDGITSDPDVYFTAIYGTVSTVRFRLGFLFDELTTANYNPSPREYGTEFGCFSLSNQVPLPVSLINFSGSLRNEVTTLQWEAENEEKFSHYEVERSVGNSRDFSAIGSRTALGSSSRISYSLPDNIANLADGPVFYRLKMVDINGQFKYSQVIMVRKGDKNLKAITINPNPVVAGDASVTLRFNAVVAGPVTIRVVDMTGRVVQQQQNKVSQGANSIPLGNLHKLPPGTYMIQCDNQGELQKVKFTVVSY